VQGGLDQRNPVHGSDAIKSEGIDNRSSSGGGGNAPRASRATYDSLRLVMSAVLEDVHGWTTVCMVITRSVYVPSGMP
jgi:hypothetical protein